MIPIISILGMPASGKSTLGLRLARQFNLHYFYLDNSPIRHDTFDHHLILDWFQRSIKKISEEGEYNAILLDGFPARADQARAVREALGSYLPDIAIIVGCPEQVARHRFFERAGRDRHVIKAMERRFADHKNNIELMFKEAFDQTGFVMTINDGDMTIDQAYDALVSMLNRVDAWKAIVTPRPS
ncbi:P-loop containing nucleoside triphosphate hydrolase protein [Hypomontagnella submonticulosa]|nr:P-loop containing nucleoside triphosphate hydrolase protein [Hypomontagnella submonticulosa]